MNRHERRKEFSKKKSQLPARDLKIIRQFLHKVGVEAELRMMKRGEKKEAYFFALRDICVRMGIIEPEKKSENSDTSSPYAPISPTV